MEGNDASFKKELVHGEDYATREQARASIFEYIEAFYNRVRLHSSLGFYLPRSLNGRTTRNTLNFVSTFRGEDQSRYPPTP